MQQTLLEWIGYLAPVIILVSMTMNSIVKFRWINFVGAAFFSIYGYFIDVLPVFILNGVIALIDVYYLFIIYNKKETFETLEIKQGDEYLLKFLKFHNAEIQKICPGFAYNPDMNTMSFYILRNMSVAGIFLAHRQNDDVLVVGLDYVIPEYRDFKNGQYVYYSLQKRFIDLGFKTIKADNNSLQNDAYFKKIGFKKDATGQYYINLS